MISSRVALESLVTLSENEFSLCSEDCAKVAVLVLPKNWENGPLKEYPEENQRKFITKILQQCVMHQKSSSREYLVKSIEFAENDRIKIEIVKKQRSDEPRPHHSFTWILSLGPTISPQKIAERMLIEINTVINALSHQHKQQKPVGSFLSRLPYKSYHFIQSSEIEQLIKALNTTDFLDGLTRLLLISSTNITHHYPSSIQLKKLYSAILEACTTRSTLLSPKPEKDKILLKYLSDYRLLTRKYYETAGLMITRDDLQVLTNLIYDRLSKRLSFFNFRQLKRCLKPVPAIEEKISPVEHKLR